MTKYKIGDTIIFNSFGKAKKMIINNVIDTNDGNPLYEDEYGSGVLPLMAIIHCVKVEEPKYSAEELIPLITVKKDRISEEVEALAREVLTPKEYGLKKLGIKI